MPCYKLFETEHALAFLDAFPMTRGHALLVPKARGYATVMDMPPEVAGEVLKELPRLAKARCCLNTHFYSLNIKAAYITCTASFAPAYHFTKRAPPATPARAQAVMLATGADGVNIVQNNGKAAGQVVFHAHFHVIPRMQGDGLIKLGAHGEALGERLSLSRAAASKHLPRRNPCLPTLRSSRAGSRTLRLRFGGCGCPIRSLSRL